MRKEVNENRIDQFRKKWYESNKEAIECDITLKNMIDKFIENMININCYAQYSEKINKIIEEYDEDLECELSSKKTSYSITNYENFQVEEKQENFIGVYKITLDNRIYIGSTVKSFRTRYAQHCSKFNCLPTKEMLEQGGIFEIIEICNNMKEPEIREMENKWIAHYSDNEEWEIVNKNFAWSNEKKDNTKFHINKELKELIEELGIEKTKEILSNHIDK